MDGLEERAMAFARMCVEHELRLQAIGMRPHAKGGGDDERGLNWRQKRALRIRKKKETQRALLHGDDEDAANDNAWHHKALAMTRNAQSSTLVPTGSAWSPQLERPPLLPQFMKRPATASPAKQRPGRRGSVQA